MVTLFTYGYKRGTRPLSGGLENGEQDEGLRKNWEKREEESEFVRD